MLQEGRYYEDIVIGEIRESGTRTVSRDEMLDFSRRFDPQYFHADPLRARESVFGDIIASGIHSAALWRALDHQISGDIRWICGVAWEDVRWPHAVRSGDTLRARAENLSKRRSRSQSSRAIVECRYTMLNQRDEVVFTCRSINLIEVRTLLSQPA
ncbi:MAG: dehydratase [Pseudomonadota bacterium]|nr:dehydratase [Pseudomonadota bacterium]